MADKEFQKEPPHKADEEFQKEPPQPEARLELWPPDDNRFRHPEPVRNTMALTAFWLGALTLIPPGGCVTTMLSHPYLTTFLGIMMLMVLLQLVLVPAALIFGILGIRHRIRHPNAGGLGYAIVGIAMGILTTPLGFVIMQMMAPAPATTHGWSF